MNQKEFMDKMIELTHRNLDIAEKKNSDYAGDNDAFKNFRGCERHGISLGQGILVRMEDKMARIGNLLRNPPKVDESLVETAMDLANYALILAVWWTHERTAKANVVGRDDTIDADRVFGSPSGTASGVSTPWPFGDVNGKYSDRSNLYDPIGD